MTPPRLAQWLLERRFPADAAESIIGDLTEEFAIRASRDGDGAARRWFWRQTLTSLAARRRRDLADAAPRRLLRGVPQDLRFALRSLRRSPGFALTAIATLAIGIGAATAVGTAASRTLLQPLPFPNGDRLVAVGADDGGQIGGVGFETAMDWRARMTSFDELALVRSWQPTLTDPNGAVRLNGVRVSGSYFRMLGIRPALGRDFETTDDTPAAPRVAILSDGLWRRQFAASPSAIGSTIDFNGTKYTIVGVLPASFEPLISERFYSRAEIWAPLGYAIGGDSACRTCQHLKAVARLRPGATVADARAEMSAVHAGLRRAYPDAYKEAPPLVRALHEVISESMARPMLFLLGAVGFVLLVACANVAGLLVARASDRTQEMALRSALGASRGRIVRQLLVESAMLAMLSTALGLALARMGLSLLAASAPMKIPRVDGVASDPWLYGIAALVSLVPLLACGLLPALVSSRLNIETTLREGRQTATRGALRLREWLMAVEIAAALLVVATGGLMYRTVDHLLHVDPGFRTDGVLTAGLSLIGQRWAEDADVRAFQTELLRRVRALPGVEAAALAGQIPLGGNWDRWSFRVIGRPAPADADRPQAERYSVTPGYFDVMGIPLKQGRAIAESDRFAADKVIVINETTARQIFPGESPIGQQLRFGSDRNPRVMTIVGVVGDVRHYSLATAATPQFYTSQEQFTDSYLTLVVHTSSPDAIAAAIRREVAALAPSVPVYKVEPLAAIVSSSIATRSFLMTLLAVLGAVTLSLAGVGLYGVVSQTVGARRRELGIRVALGASRTSVLALIARRGFGIFAGGAVAGLVAAAGAGSLFESQLYDTSPLDPLTLLVSTGVLAGVAALAHIVPMRRALRADPREALKAD